MSPISENDIKAISFLEIESDLSFARKPFQKKNDKYIYCFKDRSFTIQRYKLYKGPWVYFFYIQSNGQTLRVRIPEVLLSHLNVGDSFSGVDIEIYYRANTCWLYSLNGVVSFLDLYKQFHFLDEPSSLKVLSKRPITEGEHDIFMMSKWSSIWVLTFSVIFPFTLSGLLLEELSITIIFLIICSPLIYLIFKVAKKRENYIASRMVYRLKGNVSFDEEKEVYLIEDRELKLHRKWRKVLEEKNNWGEVETEAIMHTYDNWNTVAKQSFQPITFKAVGLTLNESSIKSTRGWRVLALYFTCLMPLLFITPIIDMAEDVLWLSD